MFGRLKTSVRSVGGLSIALAVGILIAGCGSCSLSHEALVTKANTACQRADSAVSKLGVPTASLQGLTEYASKVLPISQALAHLTSRRSTGLLPRCRTVIRD
jgi:hypothetical protein